MCVCNKCILGNLMLLCSLKVRTIFIGRNYKSILLFFLGWQSEIYDTLIKNIPMKTYFGYKLKYSRSDVRKVRVVWSRRLWWYSFFNAQVNFSRNTRAGYYNFCLPRDRGQILNFSFYFKKKANEICIWLNEKLRNYFTKKSIFIDETSRFK